MDVQAFLRDVQREAWYAGQVVHVEEVPERSARLRDLGRPLDPRIQARLEALGAWPLYSHQVEAICALDRGQNVMVATPAASGKTLCYNIPVTEAFLADRSTRALYLYPTKALAQDQLRAFQRLLLPEDGVSVAIYTGDTPHAERGAIRRHAAAVFTNPDMLHVGVLPNHRAWSRLLRGLRYVVVDEAHVYRGVFGSHVAVLLRRLRRLCHRYGSAPQFILSSATLGNPQEHAERLIGLPFHAVTEDGSPYGGKTFIFWDSPVIDEAKGTRRSSTTEATVLLVELVRRKVRTIAFVRARRLAELLYLYARRQLSTLSRELAERIASYRASYLPEHRRSVERRLSNGQLLGVTATNALELGIDIGDLDATLLVGYPGSIASTWQQAGRSGRRGARSLSVLIAQDNPLDQYYMRHPEAFFGRSTENALLSLENSHILAPHLLCAAYEAPLSPADASLFGDGFGRQVGVLEAGGLLHRRGQRWYLDPRVAYPAAEVNIRSTSPDAYAVVEQETGALLEMVEASSAFFQLHQGAVYLHQGESYLVRELDIQARIAKVVMTDVPYYTQSRDLTDIRVLRVLEERPVGRGYAYLGQVEVSTAVIAYRRKAHYTEEVLGEEYLDLPTQAFTTVALWFDLPPTVLEEIDRQRLDLAGGLHAAEHAAIGVLPAFALCDRNDIGGVSTPLHPDTAQPQVFIYDGHPGGVGIAERGFHILERLWEATLETVSACPCQSGCPSCIQSPKCGNNNHPLDKDVAVLLLRGLLGYA